MIRSGFYIGCLVLGCLASFSPAMADQQTWEDRKREQNSRDHNSQAPSGEQGRRQTSDESDDEYSESRRAPASNSQPTDEEFEAFVDGNLLFVAFHEMGHALVSEFDLPIAGREEDAVDRLAIWLMTPADQESTPDYLINAMEGWFLAGEETMDDVSWWGEHGSNTQRAYQIACLLYGDNPDRHQEVADYAELPDERRESCIDEAQSNNRAWENLLAATIKEDNSPASRAVTVSYESTSEYRDERSYLQSLGLLEDLAELMNETYQLKRGIRLQGAECDEPNAYWDPQNRALTMCYELVREYQDMAQQNLFED